MRFFNRLQMLIVGVVAMGAVQAGASGVQPAGTTFKVDYSKVRESVDAVIAKGSPSGDVRLADKAVPDFDTMSHTAWGMLVGEECASVYYESDQNLPEGKGSIELIIKPVDWEPSDNVMHMFLQTITSGKTPFGKLFIYKYKQSGISVYLEYNENGDKVFLRDHKTLKWEKGSWHHIVVTYDLNQEMALYIDGLKMDKARLKSDCTWPKRFSVGPAGKGMGWKDGKTSISHLQMYDRPLLADEVRALAKNKFPDLKIDVSAAGKAAIDEVVMGKRSRWFETGKPKLGLDALKGDTVLPPWTPVEFGQNRIGVWGRQYSLENNSLLNSVVATGTDMLSKPIEMVLENKSVVFGAPKLISQEKGRVVLARSATSAAADLTLKYSFEYDGLVWCELTLKPKQTISNLALRIPFEEDSSEFIHYVGAPKKYESQDYPKNSYSRALSREEGAVFQSGLKTSVWIGNNERGLLWFTESDQFWWPKDRENTIHADRATDGSLTLNVDMITEALPLKDQEPITIQFGFMATPVKPMPTGWRGWTYSAQYDSFVGETRGNNLIYWPNEWRFMSLDPDPTRIQNLEANRSKIAKDREAGRKIIPYWTRLHAVGKKGEKEVPDVDYMLEHWAAAPNLPSSGARLQFRASTSSDWADYLVWCADEWGKVMGHMDGVYIDETQPIPNTRAETGGGYDSLDGERRATYELFGSRNMIKRMTYNIWKENGETPFSVAHCSATHTMQNLSMYTAMLIGEQYYNGYFTKNPEFLPPPDNEEERFYHFSYAMPIDRVRAECYSKQWGSVMVFLPCLKFDKELMGSPVSARDMLSRIMQADMVIWPLFGNREEVMKTQRFRNDFGIADAAVEFIPYWGNKSITADVEDVVVGYYKNDGKILAIISNLNRSAKKVRITFNDVVVTSVQNAETKKTILVEGGSVELEMKRNDYLALRINY